MATGGQVNLGEILICSICQEDVNIPKTLPCLHTFCERCIADYIVNTERKSGHKLSNYSCPVCRTVVTPLDPDADARKWVDELKHEDKSNQITSVSGNEIDNRQECHVCKRLNNVTMAVNWCRECQEALCNNCSRIHSAIKTSASHAVIQIEEMMGRSNLKEVATDTCPMHESKVVELYCFDHDVLCCVLCCAVQHRTCKDVRAVVDIIEDKKVGVDVFKTDLQKISLSTQSLLKSIKTEKSQHEKSFKDTETSARSTVQAIKDNLDSLLIVFIKELNLKEDEVEISTDSDIRKVEDLLRVISEAENSFRSVQKYGTLVQLFVYSKQLRSDLGKAIGTVINDLNKEEKNFKVNFVLNDILVRSLGLQSLGTLEDVMSERHFIVEFRRTVDDFLSELGAVSFDNVKVKRIKTILLTGINIYGGISIDKNHIIVCSNGSELHVVNIGTGLILTSVTSSSKRFAYDEKRSVLFVSGYGGFFNRTEINQDQRNFGKLQQIKAGGTYCGGVCVHDDYVYIMIGSQVQKMKTTTTNAQFECCFVVDTDCTALNGIAIDKKNKRLVYTSQKSNVVGVSLEGKTVFSYKDEKIKKVTSVAVDSRRLIFAGDESGCVHLISEDGKQRKTLIDKCEKISKVCDVWLDIDEKKLFVCGNHFVEIYSLEKH